MHHIGVIGDSVSMRASAGRRETWMYHYKQLRPADQFESGFFSDGDALDLVNDTDTYLACMKSIRDASILVVWLPIWAQIFISNRPGANIDFVYRGLVQRLTTCTSCPLFIISAPRPLKSVGGRYIGTKRFGTFRYNHQLKAVTSLFNCTMVNVTPALAKAGRMYMHNDLLRTTEVGAFTVAKALDRAINGNSIIRIPRDLSKPRRFESYGGAYLPHRPAYA